MKVYIKSAVSIQNLKEQFAQGMSDDLFNQLISLDPTLPEQTPGVENNKGGKYCPWILRQYKKGNLTEADFDNLYDALHMFSTQYRKYPKTDLGQYKTVEEFLQDTHAVGNRELTEKEKAKLLKKQAHNAGDEDKRFLVEDGDWEVWQPLTYQGSISLARTGGTKASWCTAYEGNDNYWQSYTRRGPLYIFINTKDPNEKYQLHFDSNSWYDIHDCSRGMEAFYKFASEHPAIEQLFEIKTEDGIQYRAGEVVGFDPNAKDLIFNDEVTDITHRFPEGLERVAFLNPQCTIKPGMFKGLTHLYKVKLPTALKEIPSECFEGCTSLESIKIPDSVTVYGPDAFADCTSLREIKHSARLAKLNKRCFKNCKNLQSALPDTISYIAEFAFEGCGLKSFRIPDAMTTINNDLFKDSAISEINLNNAERVGAHSFENAKVVDIDLSRINHFGSCAFKGCKDATFFNISDDVDYFGPFAFMDCENITDTIVIKPEATVHPSAFDGCLNATIIWEREDEDYEFNDIGKLICPDSCKKLIENNKKWVPIETTSGKVYTPESEE